MTLSELSINRPVFATMLTFALIVFGLIGYSRLSISEDPAVELPVVSISTTLKGARPESMETEVTDVIEDEINTVEGIKHITSTSRLGQSQIIAEFELGRNIDIAAQDVRDKISRIMRELPKGIDPPIINKVNPQASPIMWIPVFGQKSLQDLNEYADKELKPRFEGKPGVGSVWEGGFRRRTIRIWLDPLRLEAFGLSVADVVDALSRKNVEIPGGKVENRNIEFNIKTEGRLLSASAFNNLILAYRDDSPIRIKDVGFVEDGLEDKTRLLRFNKKPSVALGIAKRQGANTVQVANIIREEVQRAKKSLPRGIKIEVTYDVSRFILESIEEVQFALIYGGLLAVLVVFFFLRNLIVTLIISLAIPTSFIATFGFMYFLNFTLNNMTLLALALMVGVVIDDAIIVLENIFRHRESGKGALEAARVGTKEITFAAMAATFSLVAVFTPVAFIKGIIGRYFFEFGITVAVSVMISLFVALTLTPMLCSRFLRIKEKQGKISSAIEKLIKKLQETYGAVLGFSLRHKFIIILIALSIMISSFKIWSFLGKEFIPSQDRGSFLIHFETPVSSSISYTEEMMKKCEKVVDEIPEIKYYFGVIGFRGGVNRGVIFTTLVPRDKRKRTQQEIMAYLRRRLKEIPGWRIYLQEFSHSFGAERGYPIEFTIQGPDLAELERLSEEIMRRMKSHAGIVDVNSDLERGKPDIRVYIDRDKAEELGLDVASIASNISTLFAGQDVTKFKSGGELYDIRVKAIPHFRANPMDLMKPMVRTKDDMLVPLGDVIRLEEGIGFNEIHRKDGKRSVTITANVQGITQGEALKIVSHICEEILPENYTMTLSGRAEIFKESFRSIFFAIFLAIIATYMILASQFESFTHPLTIMLALPLSIVGAFGSLWLTGNTINIYSLIGMILLIGLVTKNSILLVDYTNVLRERGMEREEAVEQAALTRLRPILMTAFSMIFGVLPIALGIGPGAETRVPMGVATIGGMLSSTLLTLVVVPVVYCLLDQVAEKMGTFLKSTIHT